MPIEPREFSCMDDSPLNNGWGYLDEDDFPMGLNFPKVVDKENIPLENDEMEDE